MMLLRARGTVRHQVFLLVFAVIFYKTAGQQDNQGNEFFLTFIENIPPPQLLVFVTTAETSAVSFTIETSESFNASTARAGEVTTFVFDLSFQLVSETERDKWIYLKAEGDKKIIVYGASERQASTDTFLGLPVQNDLGNNLTYVAVMEDNLPSTQAEIGIVAVANNTVLSITPTQDVIVGTTSVSAHSTAQITLNRQDTLLLRSFSDLTGTRVESNNQISFFSGHECTNVPGGVLACDFLVEQLPPVQSWGNRFATAPLLTRLSFDVFRIVAGDMPTDVYIQCTPSNGGNGYNMTVSLESYAFHVMTIPSTDFCWIEGTERILVVQFSVGSNVDSVPSDPFMAMVPPVDQYSNSYTLATVPSVVQNYTHYVNIYIPVAFAQFDQIFLDGVPLSQFTAEPINRLEETQVYSVRTNVSEGVHTLSHTNPVAQIGVIVYGFGEFNSYGYPGGIRVGIIEETNSIGLTLTEGSTRSAQVIWFQPVLEAGEIILGYNVSLKEITSADDSVLVFGYITQNTSVTLDNLEPYQEYTICVGVLTDGATMIPTTCLSFRTLGVPPEYQVDSKFTVEEGSQLRVDLVLLSNPQPTGFTWYFNGNTLTAGGDVTFGVDFLNLGTADSSESGNYTVVATNAFGSGSASFQVVVMPPMSIGADPHYSVFLPTQQLLCYSVHGKKGHIFNLISNKKMVINALFIPDARREEVTWIGEIGIVIRDFKSGVEVNPTKLSFHTSTKSLNVDDKISLKATRIEGITISNGKTHICEASEARKPGQQPEVHVALIDAGLNFTIKFLTEHLDMIWEGTHKQPTDSHGLIGQFFQEGVVIDEVRKMLVLPGREPVPVMRRKVWQFMEREVPDVDESLCWTAMNIGYQGKGLIEGHYLDYMVEDILTSTFVFEAKYSD